MKKSLPCFDEEPSQAGPALTLWNLYDRLTRLAQDLTQATEQAGDDHASPAVTAVTEAMAPREYFEALLRVWRAREQPSGISMSEEPAWEIMLELMLARIEERELRISELSAGQIPAHSNIARFVDTLVESRLVERFANAEDEEDDYLSLSSEAARRMAELYRARSRN